MKYKVIKLYIAVIPASTIRYRVKIGKIKPASYTDSGYMLFEKD